MEVTPFLSFIVRQGLHVFSSIRSVENSSTRRLKKVKAWNRNWITSIWSNTISAWEFIWSLQINSHALTVLLYHFGDFFLKVTFLKKRPHAIMRITKKNCISKLLLIFIVYREYPNKFRMKENVLLGTLICWLRDTKQNCCVLRTLHT